MQTFGLLLLYRLQGEPTAAEVSMIVAIQIGAVDEGAVFNKSIYGCPADEINPQNALRA